MGTKRNIVITESQYRLFTEDVYVNNLDQKKGKAQLTYNRNHDKRNKGVMIKGDNLKTDKMDNTSGSDTYQVPLKNGFISYNITSINGTEVMHYFKRLFDREKTFVQDQDKNKYELIMANSECRQFLDQFNNKVSSVIEWATNGFKQQNPKITFDTCFIYPVPSSSNFNIEMAKLMTHQTLNGLSVEVLNSAMLKKNTENLELDQDFIGKNQEYYDSNRTKQDKFPGTHRQYLDTTYNKLRSWNNASPYIDKANQCAEQILTMFYKRSGQNRRLKAFYEEMANVYRDYVDAVRHISKSTEYQNAVDGQMHTLTAATVSNNPEDDTDTVASMKKYTKPESVKQRSQEIYRLLRQYAPQAMKGMKPIDIQRWEKKNFQIKKEFNDVRMGLKNWFQPDENQELVQQEVNRVNSKASVVVVFDDNVSGGATLADICLQLKNLGIQFIIPITFGVMRESWANAAIQVNKPEQWNFESRTRRLGQPLNELKDLAAKSNVTVCSLEDFKNLCRKLGVNDNNVEQYMGQYCFIEIGSSEGRVNAEIPHAHPIYDQNGQEYDANRFYNEGQWYFQKEHPNVLKLIFDDNQTFNNHLPGEKYGFDGKTPATAVKLSDWENRYNKNNFTFYFANGEDFTTDKAQRLKQFVDDNMKHGPQVKFVIHCMQGKSRSAAVGMYVANKIGQFNSEMLSDYDQDDNKNQMNIGINGKGKPKYPHKNVMTRMGELEGWNSPKDAKHTDRQWFYNTLINHPNTGYNDQVKNWTPKSKNK